PPDPHRFPYTTLFRSEDALDWVRDLLDHLPDNNRSVPEIIEDDFDDDITEDDLALDSIIPDNPSQPYDVRDVVAAIADDGDYLEDRKSTRLNSSHVKI